MTVGGCYINRRCTLFVGRGGAITRGHNVRLELEVMLWSRTHEIGPGERRCGEGVVRPITIGSCWLGARATVLGGVEIGTGSVIAAGALVNKDVPPNELWGGVPARLIRKLEEWSTRSTGGAPNSLGTLA